MVAHTDYFKGVRIGKFDAYKELASAMKKHIKVNIDDVVFFCVGTDRCSGDSLAPFIGTMLIENGYNNVIGTIDEPVHALNLEEKIKLIPKEKMVIAFDASLSGNPDNMGKFIFNSGELCAGKGIGKDLKPVGDFHVVGVVNHSFGNLNHAILANTRLSTVLSMAKEIVKAIEVSFPLETACKSYIKAVK